MENKICIYCKQEIISNAKRCPYCHSWQSKWFPDSGNPKTSLITTVTVMVVAVIWLTKSYQLVNSYLENKENKDHAEVAKTTCDVLEIVDTNFKIYGCDDDKCLIIFGRIKNPSNMNWFYPYFHVEMFDDEGNLVDVFSEKDTGLIIPKKSETNFKLAYRARQKPDKYVNSKITIRYASGF